MPKTNLRGGNKRKKGKNGTVELHRILDYAQEGQLYGQVSKTLGAGRFKVTCFELDLKNDFILSEKICHVCGKMRKRVWINENDIILISTREFTKDKGDIIHKYTNDEARTLKKQKLIPNVELVNGKVEDNSSINFEYSNNDNDNDNDNENIIKINNVESYVDINISESDLEEDDIEEL